MPVSLTRQIGAIEALIAVANGQRKPSRSLMKLIISDAEDAVATLILLAQPQRDELARAPRRERP